MTTRLTAATRCQCLAWLVATGLVASMFVPSLLCAKTPPSPPSEEDVPSETAPPEPSPDDVRIEEQLRAAFRQIPDLAETTVDVRAGVATLSGTVATPTVRDEAEAIASKIEGLLFVDNRLEVTEPAAGTKPSPPSERTVRDEAIQNTLASIFSNVDDLADVEFTVRGGVVTLRGTTVSPEAQRQAETLAQKLEGVLYVDNEIEVTTDVGERLSPALQRLVDYGRDFLQNLPLLGIVLVVLALFWLLARGVARLDILFGRISNNALVQGIVRQVVATLVFVAGVLVVLELLDVTTLVGAVLGTAGVIGIALGFAFRDIAENYLASIILSIQQPFGKNDYIEIGEARGKVVRLTTRDTVLMTLDGNHVRIPNSTVFKSITSNYTQNPLRRFDFTVGIGVEEELAAVQEIGEEALRSTPGVEEEPPPYVIVDQFGDSTMTLRFFGWIDQTAHDWYKVRSEAVRRVKGALDAVEVEVPEPMYRVLLGEMEKSPSDTPTEAEREERLEHADAAADRAPADVEVTPEIDRQIEEDRARSKETDLLES